MELSVANWQYLAAIGFICMFFVLILIIMGHRPTEIDFKKLLIRWQNFLHIDKDALEPVGEEWFYNYQFDQGGRLYEHSIRKPELNRGLSLYWLGHDLLWTVIVLKTNQDTTQVFRGLTQAAWQMEQSGLCNNELYEFLKRKIIKYRSSPTALDDASRHRLSVDILRKATTLGLSLNQYAVDSETHTYYKPLPPRDSNKEALKNFEQMSEVWSTSKREGIGDKDNLS